MSSYKNVTGSKGCTNRKNIYIIVILVTIVAAFNMVTVLLILILERTKMVGLLKALGANDWAVQKVFLYHAFLIIIFGMLLGNLLGIGLSMLQEHFHLVKLPEESYYLDHVPILIDYFNILLINAGVFLMINMILIIPSLIQSFTPISSVINSGFKFFNSGNTSFIVC